MEKEIAELLVDTGYGLEIYEEYSGRGMYGKTTTAVTCDNVSQFMESVGEAFMDMIYEAAGDDDYNTEKAEELAKVLYNLQQDNLGMGVVIY